MSEQAASKGNEVNGEINCGLLKSFLQVRTVVSAVCNMGEKVLPTVLRLSEAAKFKRREVVIGPNDP